MQGWWWGFSELHHVQRMKRRERDTQRKLAREKIKVINPIERERREQKGKIKWESEKF